MTTPASPSPSDDATPSPDDDVDRGASSQPQEARPGRGAPPASGPRRLALVSLASALVGAAVLTGILFATGAFGGSTTQAAAEPVTTSPTTDSQSLNPVALYAGAAKSVVDITASGTSTVTSPLGRQQQQSTSSGAGIVLDGQGHILTADHVVQGASSVSVTFSNGTTRSVRVAGHDATTDLAVLTVNQSGLSFHPIALGDSAALQVGDPVAAIGDPFNYERSMSTGIVSGLDRTIQGLNGFSVAHAVQTDAAIDPGNSGGPLLNSQGEVIGIVDQIATGNSGADSSTGVGFAVSSDVAKAELADLEHGSTPTHAYLGVGTAPAVDVDGGTGVVVESVQSASPAANGGVRAGDIIESVDGKALRGVNDLIATVSAGRPGQAMTLGVERGGRQLRLHVVLAGQPAQASGG
jgi:putative serine protease PepD